MEITVIARPEAPVDTLLRKVFNVMETLAASRAPRGVSDLARELGLPASNVHRILRALMTLRYVRQHPGTRAYQLTPRLFELGMASHASVDIKAAARPVMEEVGRKTGDTVALTVLDGFDLVYIDYVESIQQEVRMALTIGHRVPAHCTAAGRALLAWHPRHEALVRSAKLEAFTPRTLTSPEAILKDLEAIRRLGYAIVQGERHPLISAVAAPVLDRSGAPIAALTAIGTSDRLRLAELRTHAPLVVAAAAEVRARLTGHLDPLNAERRRPARPPSR